MQVSICVPMAVVWMRRQQFPVPVKLLSWYVYLSVLSLAASKLYPTYLPNNYGGIVGFNLGKIALFGAVYYQVLVPGRLRQAVLLATGACLAGVGVVVAHDLELAVDVSRVTQCALLAGLALLYLEQTLGRPTFRPAAHDPLWLLSVGQLFYSAGTITVFSFTYLSQDEDYQTLNFIFVSLSGLVFNWFLTLAFLRARAPVAAAATPPEPPARELARS